VAIELKLDKFKAEHKGQMELYLRWLEQCEKQENEKSPIGLILCADKSDEHVELLQLSKSGIRVAAYLTELPPRNLLRQKLYEAIKLAKARLQQKELPEPPEVENWYLSVRNATAEIYRSILKDVWLSRLFIPLSQRNAMAKNILTIQLILPAPLNVSDLLFNRGL
jgi:hypothetical protein